MVGQEVSEDPAPAKSSSEEHAKKPASVDVHQTFKSGADAALELLKETGGLHQVIDPEIHRRLVRRIDWHIMPLICIVCT
ncbi:hypothetical protein PC116_g30484 [Phytophthora cactorum]|nr:hypothetical protein PC116_g30484 [Phytophthora cactorum]